MHGGGPFEGADELDEIAGPLAMLLFHLLRDVDACMTTPPLLDQARRARTAHPAAVAPARNPQPESDEETEPLAMNLSRALDAAPEAR